MNEKDKDLNLVERLNSINSLVKSVEDKEKVEPKEVPYDSERFTSYVTEPKKVPIDVLNQLGDLFDKNNHFEKVNPSDPSIGPNTTDLILNSEKVIYIVDNNIPVAGAVLYDPTVQSYKGIIPKDYYELKSGISLNGRVQQLFFEVRADMHNLGLANRLKGIIDKLSDRTFIIVSTTDKETQSGLQKNGYTFVSEFETDWEVNPVQLWLS